MLEKRILKKNKNNKNNYTKRHWLFNKTHREDRYTGSTILFYSSFNKKTNQQNLIAKETSNQDLRKAMWAPSSGG